MPSPREGCLFCRLVAEGEHVARADGFVAVRDIAPLAETHLLVLPERHLGLVPPQETAAQDEPLGRAAEIVEAHLDLPGILRAAETAESLEIPGETEAARRGPGSVPDPVDEQAGAGPRIGVFVDAAFQFYYPENLEALSEATRSQ